MALAVERGVMGIGTLRLAFDRMQKAMPGRSKQHGTSRLHIPGQLGAPWPWTGIDHHRCALAITHLPFGEQQDQWQPFAIADGMKL